MKFSNSNSFFPNKIYIFATAKEKGTLAQVVEQWTENPCVLGSTPRGTTPPFISRTVLARGSPHPFLYELPFHPLIKTNKPNISK